jgi:hypothetical protein
MPCQQERNAEVNSRQNLSARALLFQLDSAIFLWPFAKLYWQATQKTYFFCCSFHFGHAILVLNALLILDILVVYDKLATCPANL